MPFVKRVNTPKTARLLAQLADVGDECETLAASLAAAQTRRDKLVRQASTAGATRRDVATAAKLTGGRVQQIVRR
jgi:hypothetical protein